MIYSDQMLYLKTKFDKQNLVRYKDVHLKPTDLFHQIIFGIRLSFGFPFRFGHKNIMHFPATSFSTAEPELDEFDTSRRFLLRLNLPATLPTPLDF